MPLDRVADQPAEIVARPRSPGCRRARSPRPARRHEAAPARPRQPTSTGSGGSRRPPGPARGSPRRAGGRPGVSRSRASGPPSSTRRAPAARAAGVVGDRAVAAEADVDRVGRRDEQGVRPAAVAVRDDRDERPAAARRAWPRPRRSPPAVTSGRSIGRIRIALGAAGERLAAGGVEPVVEAAVALEDRPRAELGREGADRVVRGDDEDLVDTPGAPRPRRSSARARRSVRSSRSSASSTAPSRDFAPSSAPTGMIATTRRAVSGWARRIWAWPTS